MPDRHRIERDALAALGKLPDDDRTPNAHQRRSHSFDVDAPMRADDLGRAPMRTDVPLTFAAR
jgi:hypothetical protein